MSYNSEGKYYTFEYSKTLKQGKDATDYCTIEEGGNTAKANVTGTTHNLDYNYKLGDHDSMGTNKIHLEKVENGYPYEYYIYTQIDSNTRRYLNDKYNWQHWNQIQTTNNTPDYNTFTSWHIVPYEIAEEEFNKVKNKVSKDPSYVPKYTINTLGEIIGYNQEITTTDSNGNKELKWYGDKYSNYKACVLSENSKIDNIITNNLYDIVEVNGNLRFYNEYFNSYLGENNISNYDNDDANNYSVSYKNINNIDFVLENTTVDSQEDTVNKYYAIKNNNYVRRLYRHHYSYIKDTYTDISALSYWNYHIDDNSRFTFELQEKTPYNVTRIINNNIYLPKNGNRYRIKSKGAKQNKFIKYGKEYSIVNNNSSNVSNLISQKDIFNNLEYIQFDIIYQNNKYIFFNKKDKDTSKDILGFTNIKNYTNTNELILFNFASKWNSMSTKPIEIYEFKLELSHINKYFRIKSVLNNKYLACKIINNKEELGLFNFKEK